jgi:hypothetical protein
MGGEIDVHLDTAEQMEFAKIKMDAQKPRNSEMENVMNTAELVADIFLVKEEYLAPTVTALVGTAEKVTL